MVLRQTSVDRVEECRLQLARDFARSSVTDDSAVDLLDRRHFDRRAFVWAVSSVFAVCGDFIVCPTA